MRFFQINKLNYDNIENILDEITKFLIFSSLFLCFFLYFIIINKMNTLSEDQYIRLQKQRKQQLYKNMLDQQVRVNQMKRQKDNYQKYQFDGRYAQPRNSINAYPPQENKILPPISNLYRHPRQYQMQSNRHKYSKSITEQDERTQLYLNNCEEIIRNLRELKTKKKQKESIPNAPVGMGFKKENERVPGYQMQYYPKPTYFSSSGSAYNKNVSTDPLPKKGKLQATRLTTRLNTIDDAKLSNDKYTKGYSSKKISTQKKPSNRIDKEDQQSQSPRGIKDQKKSDKKPSKIRHKLFKLVPPAKDQQSNQQSPHQQSFKQEQQQDKDLQLKISRTDQKQLGQCLSQLTRYLKNLNEDKERQKNLSKTSSPERDNSEGLSMETPVTHKRTKSPSPIEKQPINQDPDQEDKQNEDDENHQQKPRIQHFDTLKQKVMQALKQANQQSHTLFLKMSDRSTSRSPFNPKDSYSGTPTAHLKEGKSNPNLGDSSASKHATQNDQLIKMMASHLDKHNDSNQQLNKCLKQLHQYLKSQNQEIKQIITTARESQSKKQPRSSQKNSNSKPKNSLKPAKTQQEEEQEQIKSGSIKLQDAILKSLKKARLRGNILKEKIQVFRKDHPSKNQAPSVINQKKSEPINDKIEEKEAQPPQQQNYPPQQQVPQPNG